MGTASRYGSETVFPVLTVPPAEEPPHQPQQQVEDRPLDHEHQWRRIRALGIEFSSSGRDQSPCWTGVLSAPGFGYTGQIPVSIAILLQGQCSLADHRLVIRRAVIFIVEQQTAIFFPGSGHLIPGGTPHISLGYTGRSPGHNIRTGAAALLIHRTVPGASVPAPRRELFQAPQDCAPPAWPRLHSS